MALVRTGAVVLHVMRYSESSKIVRLATRDLGVQSAIARGARRPKSPIGPRLDLFASGTVTLAVREHRELQTLTELDVHDAHLELVRDLSRFSAASALAELVLRCAPTEPHPALFDALVDGLDALARAETSSVEAAALAAGWRVVAELGFRPTLERCVVCERPVGGARAFSAALGGALCRAHQREEAQPSKLSAGDATALAALLSGRWPEPALDPSHAAAHRRLLWRFVQRHLAEDRPLKAVAFWASRSWRPTSS